MEVTIPETLEGLAVTTIGDNAFRGRNMTGAVIAAGVTDIGDSAFHGNFMTAVNLPAGLTRLGAGSFYGNRLARVVIPESVTVILERRPEPTFLKTLSGQYGNRITGELFQRVPQAVGGEG
jgi:hypothetical protein